MNALLKLLVLAVLIAAASNAHAHDWYPVPCCSDQDCHALLEERGETVAETRAGWRLWDGRTIPHDLTKFSPDGRFHLCETPSKGVICFFAPQGTSQWPEAALQAALQALPVRALCGRGDAHEVILITVGDLDQEAVMSKPECEIVSITGDHSGISMVSTQPVPFNLSRGEIEQRIVQACMRLVFRADKTTGSQTVSVTRSGLIEVEMTEMPPAILAPGLPLFMLEVFSLPNRSSVDSYGFFDLNDTELVAAAEFVLGTARKAERINVSALHEAAATGRSLQ